MTKKKKIIISCIAAAVVVIGVVLTLILVNIKHYSNYTADEVRFNSHSIMRQVSIPNGTTSSADETFYHNGTQIVQNNQGKRGIYSHEEDRLVVDTIYDNITEIETTEYATYFLLTDLTQPNHIIIVDDEGEDLGLIQYDSEKQVSKADIRVKEVDVTSKRGNVKTKVENKFKRHSIEIASIDFEYDMYLEDEFEYEVWSIITTDGIKYQNIYDIDDDRYLIQTIGSASGLSIDVSKPSISVLRNGDIRFITSTTLSDADDSPIEIKVYDDKYKLKGTSVLQADFLALVLSEGHIFRAGDNFVFQASIPATSEDYDYIDTTGTEPKYFTLKTMKLSISNGKLSETKLKYVVTDATDINMDTTILTAKQIKNETLEDTKYLLINNKMQVREIDYSFNRLQRLNDDRLIAYTEEGLVKSNYVLIDNGFDLICRLDNIDDYFSTENALIITKGTTSYVCNMNGVVVATYNASNIVNLHHEDYYMVIVDTVRDGVDYVEYYLENLGYRGKMIYLNPTTGGSTFTIDGVTYSGFNYKATDEISVFTRTRETSAGVYTYEICNFDGKVLAEVSGAHSNYLTISVLSSLDDDSVIVSFNGARYYLDR